MDDNATCLLRMKSGAIGTLVASWTQYRGGDNSTVLWCENGVMKIGTVDGDEVIVELTNGTVETYKVGAMATNEKTSTKRRDRCIRRIHCDQDASIHLG